MNLIIVSSNKITHSLRWFSRNRTEIKKVFPGVDLVELPSNHKIFHGKYKFNNGLPKIHEHDAQPAKAYGIIVEGRLVCLYTHESDLGDGWEDAEVHNDSEQIRLDSAKNK